MCIIQNKSGKQNNVKSTFSFLKQKFKYLKIKKHVNDVTFRTDIFFKVKGEKIRKIRQKKFILCLLNLRKKQVNK